MVIQNKNNIDWLFKLDRYKQIIAFVLLTPKHDKLLQKSVFGFVEYWDMFLMLGT